MINTVCLNMYLKNLIFQKSNFSLQTVCVSLNLWKNRLLFLVRVKKTWRWTQKNKQYSPHITSWWIMRRIRSKSTPWTCLSITHSLNYSVSQNKQENKKNKHYFPHITCVLWDLLGAKVLYEPVCPLLTHLITQSVKTNKKTRKIIKFSLI